MAMNTNHSATDDLYQVHRPVYCLRTFDGEFEEKPEDVDIKTQIQKAKDKCARNLTWRNVGMRMVGLMPFIMFMRRYYKKSYLRNDLIAGITLLIFQIPQGLAYGLLAGLRPIHGLYTSLFPPLVYVFFGTSRHLSTGTFSLLSLLIADPVSRFATLTLNATVDNMTITEADIEFEKVKIAACATFMAGAFEIVMGFLHLGVLTSYMSDALVSGLTTGAACHVITSQIITCLGVSVQRYPSVGKIVMIYVDIFSHIKETSVPTMIASIICIVILVIVKEFINPKVKNKIKMPIPIELILVIIAALIGHFCQLDERFGIRKVGNIPKGLPHPILPDFALFKELIGSAISLTVVCFVVSCSLTKMMATKNNYEVDYNQELIALGLANVTGSFLQCVMAGGNLSRNAVVADAGMKSQQIANLVSCILLVLVLLFIGECFSPLPTCVLASIIIVALKGMFKQVEQLPQLWKVSIYDFLIWVVSCVAVIFLDVTYGLAVGFAFSILTIVCRTQNPECRLIGRIPQTDIYKDVSVYPEAQEITGIKIFRFDGAVYFANAERFKTSLYRMTGKNPAQILIARHKRMKKELKRQKMENMNQEVKKSLISHKGSDQIPAITVTSEAKELRSVLENEEPAPTSNNELTVGNPALDQISTDSTQIDVNSEDVHHIILDCSTWAYIDSVGIRILKEIISQYQKCDITVYMAVLKASVRDMFSRTQLYETVDKDYMYLTVHDAVIAALSGYQDVKNEEENECEAVTADV